MNSRMKRIASGLLLAVVWGWSAPAQSTNGLLDSFETSADLSRFTRNNCLVFSSTNGVTDGQKSGLVIFQNVAWPNIYFQSGTGFTNGDWRAWGGIAVDILNTNSQAVTVDLRVDDDFSADGVHHCQTGSIGVPAAQALSVVMPFTDYVPSGMRGGPPILFGAVNMSVYGSAIDFSHIVAFQIFLPQPGRQVALVIDRIRLVPPAALTNLADRYGQFTGGDWPGKIHQDSDFQVQETNELQWLAANPKPSDRDIYGAWGSGPQFSSTGYFRTAFVTNGVEVNPSSVPANQGRWWLVDPPGRLFFSVGVDVIDYGQTTAVTGRENLFTWLPATGDPLAQFSQPGASRTANFYGMNLYRKYGANWNVMARTRALDRLDSWGFNTIGNWSSSDLFAVRRVPYTVAVGYDTSSLATFSSANQQMVDVFDPSFSSKVAAGISGATSIRRNDLWCLGYFVENELPWAGWSSSVVDQYALPIGVLTAASSLPSKAEFARELQAKYSSVAALNTAWGTTLSSWSDVSNNIVTLPASPSAACLTDMSTFLTNFACRYFSVISTNMRQYAPNQLYLGCRFASRPLEAVRAAIQYCDVISFNIYIRSLDTNTWAFTGMLNKPCIIGEFHFGALDRGMFSPGLVQAVNQNDRGQAYQEYVRSVLSLPGFVGCHWFEYDDEPLTGRFDGENYNIGLVSGTDTPYWELVFAVRQILSEIYTPFAPTRLSVSSWASALTLSWPFLPEEFRLEATSSLSVGSVWNPVRNEPALVGVNKSVHLPRDSGASYFQLRKP
jgi:hypothetical protein